MRIRLDYGPGDRVYYVKKLRLGAEVRSGFCTEIIAKKDGVYVRIENHGLAPAGAVFADPERARTACRNYNEKQERVTA